MTELEKEELRKALDKELDKVIGDDHRKQIRYCRKKAIENLGLKIVSPYTRKGYKEPKDCLKWGSQAGWDKYFFVKR